MDLLRQPELAKKMGEAARRAVAMEFSTEDMIGRVASLYDNLLGRDLTARRLAA